MNLQELIDFHVTGAEACEAYAVTPGASEAKNKDIAKHYTKRAKWHRDAIALVQGLSAGEAALREELRKWKEIAFRHSEDRDEIQQRLTVAEQALKFYADGDHLLLADADAWDTCSGEPVNFLHDEAGTASVEDGSIAKAALKPAAEGEGS